MVKFKSNVMEFQTGNGGIKIFPATLGGRVRLAHGLVSVPTSASTAILELVRLPKGARLLPMSQVHLNGYNGGMSIKVGDAIDTSRYFLGLCPGSAETSVFLDRSRFKEYIMPEETTVFATIGGEGLAAGCEIAFDILYVVD